VKARAPGKVVLSGAYSVLEGAPALVAAVDRYVVADSVRPATTITAEVGAAIHLGALDRGVWFDARPLRRAAATAPADAGGKLGLGSSAAILVASLGAVLLARGVPEPALASTVFPLALRAHRAAQPGGSGIDVAASCFGGVLRFELDAGDGTANARAQELPVGLVLEIWVCAAEASTQAMIAEVRALRAAEPEIYGRLIAQASAAARDVIEASSAGSWIQGLAEQFRALAALGAAAGSAIVTPEVAALGALAREQDACFGPAGAGGGDIALWAGLAPSPARFRARAAELGLSALPLAIGAAGVHRIPG